MEEVICFGSLKTWITTSTDTTINAETMTFGLGTIAAMTMKSMIAKNIHTDLGSKVILLFLRRKCSKI